MRILLATTSRNMAVEATSKAHTEKAATALAMDKATDMPRNLTIRARGKITKMRSNYLYQF
jgi:hypothetical protein